MSDQSTPETDKAERMAYAQEHMVPTEFARRLERERDEAREALRTLAEHGEIEIQKLIKERDEAREAADKWRKLHDIKDELFKKGIAEVERERDEAREAAAMWESSSDAMERAGAEQARRADENCEWALRAERERDEAREENKKFREALEWIAERYDDFKPLHSVAMDAYEMSCIAKSALRKEES